MAIAKRLIARPMSALDLCAFLVGLDGQAIALRRLARASGSRPSFVSVEEAVRRIHERNAKAVLEVHELRLKCRSLAEASPREQGRLPPT